jgi:hypothetical protein
LVSVAALAQETDTPAPITITQQSVTSESNFLIKGFPLVAAIYPLLGIDTVIADLRSSHRAQIFCIFTIVGHDSGQARRNARFPKFNGVSQQTCESVLCKLSWNELLAYRFCKEAWRQRPLVEQEIVKSKPVESVIEREFRLHPQFHDARLTVEVAGRLPGQRSSGRVPVGPSP